MQNDFENVDFVQNVNINFSDSLETNGIELQQIFSDFCQDKCAAAKFRKIAAAGRLRGISKKNINHNSFKLSKLGRLILF